MIRTTTAAVAIFATSSIVAFADDPRAFIGVEFEMKGVVCSNVPDTQKLGTLMTRQQIHVDDEILKTIASNKLACKIIDQAAMYVGPASNSEFTLADRHFIIDHYVPVESVDDFYVWRTLHPVLSTDGGL